MINKEEHKKQTISGLRWTVLDQIINQAVTFGLGIFLMTLLPPTSFGLLGMVTVFSGFLSVFKDFGLGSSIIQRKDITNQDLDTVFWVTVALGIFLTILLIGLSPIIATYYEEPKLVNITIGLSFLFVIQSLSSIHLSLLKKKMNFKFLFQVKVAATLLAGITALVMAYLDYGVWALVIQQLLNATLLTLLLFIFNNYTPKFQFGKKILNSHLKFSLPLLGRSSMNYWSRNADNFFIGKFLGAELLGIYTRSYSIMMLPVSRISGVISSVMFPSLSIIQEDDDRIKLVFLKIPRIISHISFPIMLILAISAEQIVNILFTKEWYFMAELLPILAIIGSLQSLGTLNGNIFLVKNQTLLAFKLNIMNSISYIIGFYFSSQYGLKEVVITYLFLNIFLMFINWYYVAKLMDMSLWSLFNNIKFSLICFTLIYIIGITSNNFFILLNDIIFLLIVLIGVPFLWLAFNRIIFEKQFKELKETIMQIINNK